MHGRSFPWPERQSGARLALRRGRMAVDCELSGGWDAAPSVALMAAAWFAILGGRGWRRSVAGAGAADWREGCVGRTNLGGRVRWSEGAQTGRQGGEVACVRLQTSWGCKRGGRLRVFGPCCPSTLGAFAGEVGVGESFESQCLWVEVVRFKPQWRLQAVASLGPGRKLV